jgi:cytidylate kinase
MSIVVISSDSFCRGAELAARVAADLGYDALGSEIETAASADLGVSLEKPRQAPGSSPSHSTRPSRARKRRIIAYFQASLITALSRGDVLYHGEIGHLFVANVSHVLKVKVTADLRDRVALRMEVEKLSETRARDLLIKEEEFRRKWSSELLGVDATDTSIFDLIINLTQIGADSACNTISQTARDVQFRPVTYSIKTMHDHELACRIKARLIKDYPDVEVASRDGEVSIRARSLTTGKKNRTNSVRSLVLGMKGATHVLFE